jgi:hypothetical protein
MNNNTKTHLLDICDSLETSLKELRTLLTSSSTTKVKYTLIVMMPDGERIENKKPTDTFVNVIEKIGIERVRDLNIIATGVSKNRAVPLPLISPYSDPHSQRKSGSYFIAVGNSTPQKKKWLQEIASRLGIKMEVCVREKLGRTQ